MAEPNLLFYGDNLDVLRQHIRDETVDLVYLDPPFNSNASYNVLFAEHGTKSASQIRAFKDSWHWDEAAAFDYQTTVEQGGRVADALRAFRTLLGTSPDVRRGTGMLAYLSMMAPRLLELRRVMKSTASIYLHCDPTASHYLKLLMDAVFGAVNYRNEVIWKRTGAHGSTRGFGPVHDTLLVFSKTETYAWAPIFQQQPEYIAQRYTQTDERGRRFYPVTLHAAGTRKGSSGLPWRGIDITAKGGHWKYTIEGLEQLDAAGDIYWPSRGSMPRLKMYLDAAKGAALQDVWTDIPPINAVAAERLGYPTQKPLALMERIITTSSDQGDLVLDPFCGCGTTVDAAQKLGRRWIGIDITHLAIGLIKHRLADAYGPAIASTYRVIGEPTDVEGAAQLAHDDPFQFQAWALGLVNARVATSAKKGGDYGIDGRLYFHDDAGRAATTKQVIFSVKAGHLVPAFVRDLRGVLDREEAQIGVVISFEEPSAGMRAEAAAAGFYASPWGGQYPRLQLLTVAELLAGKGIAYPHLTGGNVTHRRAPRADLLAAEQPDLSYGEVPKSN